MLTPDHIYLDAQVDNAEQAIRVSGDCLLRAGAITSDYIDAMVHNWQENGAYFVIAPGLALPHARPECGVLEAQISIVRLQTPVVFGNEENDPVDLVIGLAATGSQQHVQLIQKVALVLSDERKYAALKQATDKESVMALFNASSYAKSA
ncbi:Ascorbate-specific PTS system EIIA component [Vibrio stylophorae]|uniref:Ascorbate-specific PTS system EIIA component n=1 Tax=Vibrio stylophorae TaxID=659351 RepID=A0ABN8E1H0_9VIBR|nr:PTS sugar transporter subunit IIA [Vibrio stylophorae]CAH0535252.1 Ascorbate-specific PTS system EIIA component [Vibrio stylophorae]